ncbi:MAG: alpha-E domain-containing protein [Sedimenticola sp.]|uniref:Alpha-E domain-containing protein n=1 Tax=Sedimenticola thiotaurini TaxID=1543721 RepID=A0A558CMY1_9GAMM|nr:alpha-E domain-containing protein [Sedimenticola sp.]MCW8921247.1 alpha-E domain-containing protein [Sedimenticola sp.]MCW8947173.1 alpha-E domain-containing protein [Sedimenticola sp.]TVT50133.1 MAG: alpha-E domain-containing protein [Sedimenticola thiotaurini]
MLSRVAENIYWMARYIERAENTARLVMVNTNLLLDLPKGLQPGWQPIIEILGTEAIFLQSNAEFNERAVLKFLIADPQSPSSILYSLQLARENARTIRDIIPREGWEQVNDLYLMAKSKAASGYTKKGRYDYLKNIVLGAQTITGLLAGTMLHDIGYDFLRMGRNLERAEMTTRIIDVRSANLLEEHEGLTPYENIQWMSVLKSLTAYQMYRRTIQVRVRRKDVLKFLLKDKQFPRAFFHNLLEVKSCLQDLPRSEEAITQLNEVGKKVLRADQAILQQDELHQFIDELQLGLAQINQVITRTYFQ